MKNSIKHFFSFSNINRIFTFPVSLIVLILIVITHHKIRLERSDNKEWGINNKIDKFSNTVSSTTDKVIKEFKEI